MPAAKKLTLSERQRKELEAWTKNPPKPYLRRKAWAILLVAAGKPIYVVAQDRRVRAHRTTVSQWIQRYEAQGLDGLRQAKGQGRKPRFSPSLPGGSTTGNGTPLAS